MALERELDHSRRLNLLGTLASGVAHELNNLFTPALALIESARRDPTNSEQANKAVERAATAVSQGAKIATAILGFSADTQPSQAADVREAVDAALCLLIPDPSRDGIAVRVEVPSGVMVEIDPVCLQHVLLNLFLNARRAMRLRGGCLDVRVVGASSRSPWNTTPRSTKVTIEVRDTGCGMGPALLPHVFEPFVTGGNADNPRGSKTVRYPNTGLGLAVTKRLMEQAGGSIAVRSKIGIGTCFALRFRRQGSKVNARAA